MIQNTTYKLTVAIPTYNRLEKLKLCLQRLLQQDKAEQIEIIVSDNASTDGTGAYMETLAEEKKNIHYYRNKENVGPDRNFLNCYEKAKGEYILLLGDDDYLLEHAVERLLHTLEKNPVFVHLNTSGVISEQPFVHGTPRFEENGIKIYTKRDGILQEVGIFITFMSSLVLKTELVKKIEKKEQFIGTYFIQSYIALCTMKENGTYIIDTFNYLAASANKTVGYDLYEVWFYNYRRLIMEGGIKGGFSEKVLEDVYYRTTKSVIKGFIVQFRCSCKNQKKWNKAYIWSCLSDYPDLKCLFWILVNCPVPILKIMGKIYGK